MNKKHYTSRLFSKRLWDNGCRLKSDYYWIRKYLKDELVLVDKEYKRKPDLDYPEKIPAYDLLWDVCMKYGKEFFGKESIDHEYAYYMQEGDPQCESAYLVRTKAIVTSLFHPLYSKQVIENDIWKHCLFNPKNKKDA